MTDNNDAICRGSYTMGNACGRCAKCESFLLGLIEELTDFDLCRYDHHGKCQSHSPHERPCPHEMAQKVLRLGRGQ